uniref:MPN domain-containing protein n=1 Tax=Amphimedon queenslandica TaxID=400682 RepID=A0A1X7TST2_AMPQE
AKSYFAEGELEQAFILYNKFATLFIEKLPKHHEYSRAPATEKQRVKKLVKSSFDQALLCKERLKEKYTQEKELFIQRRESERAIEERKATEEREKREERERMIREQEEKKRREELEERARLEAYLAETPTQEKKLPLTTPTTPSKPDPQLSEPRPQATEAPPTIQIEGEEGGVNDDDDDEGCVSYDDMLLLSNNQPYYYDDDEEEMETGGGGIPTSTEGGKPTSTGGGVPTFIGGGKPTSTGGWVPVDGGMRGDVPTSTGKEESDHVSLTATDAKLSKVLPSIVPQVIERSRSEQTQNCQAPPPTNYQAPPPTNYQAPPYQTPPTGYQAPPTNYQGAYQVPPPNQSKNTLKITHIIVPKQMGKADSCETMKEEELFDALDKHDLITVGWIHTHPSQTAFMSSVDLHTHYSYQIMLQEAIAIVVAPKYDKVGNFTLTQPHGLNYIGRCSGKGFHTHPKEPPLYEGCHGNLITPTLREIPWAAVIGLVD